jgi:hypothetical protein
LYALVAENITICEIRLSDPVEVDVIVRKVQDTEIPLLFREVRGTVTVDPPALIVGLPREESVTESFPAPVIADVFP